MEALGKLESFLDYMTVQMRQSRGPRCCTIPWRPVSPPLLFLRARSTPASASARTPHFSPK